MDEDKIKLEKRVCRHVKIRAVCRKLIRVFIWALILYVAITYTFMPYIPVESNRRAVNTLVLMIGAIALYITYLARCPVCKRWIDTDSYWGYRGFKFRGPHPGTSKLPNICPYCGTNFGKYDEDGWA